MWKTVKLGDVCLVRRGTTITKKQTADGGIPVIGGGTKPTYYHNQANREANCITVSGSGASAGFVNKWEQEIFASDCSTVEPKDETQSHQFVYYYLLSQQQYIYDNFRSGAAQPHVYAKDIATLPFPIIPLAEQQRIVAKLDAAFDEIDRAIEITERRIDVTQAAFSKIVDKEFDTLRESFLECQLGEVISSFEYGTSTKCSKVGNFPVLRMGNMQAGKFELDDLVYLDDKHEQQKYNVKSGDVFFNRTNSPLHVGKTAIYEYDRECLFAGYLIRLNFNRSSVDGKFLTYYLNSPKIREFGYSVMTSSVNQANINATKLKAYPYIKVDLHTQNEVSGKLFQIECLFDDAVLHLKRTLSAYKILKSKCLAQEFQPQQSEAA